MTTSHQHKEICMPQFKKYPRLNLTQDKKNLLKDKHPTSKITDLIMHTIKAVSLLHFQSILKSKWMAISCLPSVALMKKPQELSMVQEIITHRLHTHKIFGKERMDLKDLEYTKGSRNLTTSSVVTPKKTNRTN